MLAGSVDIEVCTKGMLCFVLTQEFTPPNIKGLFGLRIAWNGMTPFHSDGGFVRSVSTWNGTRSFLENEYSHKIRNTPVRPIRPDEVEPFANHVHKPEEAAIGARRDEQVTAPAQANAGCGP